MPRPHHGTAEFVPFVCMPSPISRQTERADRSPLQLRFPTTHDVSAPASNVSRPAQRLRPYGLKTCQVASATLYTEGSDGFVASAAASIATGWSDPVPGWDLHPLLTSAFHGAHEMASSDESYPILLAQQFSVAATLQVCS
jgi:hypothetical protein